MIRALIFDFGGVLSPFPEPEEQLAWDRRLGLPPGGTIHLLYGDEDWALAGTGQISDEEFWQRAEAKLPPNVREAFRAFQADYLRPDRLDCALVEWLEARRGAYRTALLSNASLALEPFLVESGLLPLFDSVVNSARVGCTKPDPAIYRIALERLGVGPDEALFLDDLPWNVESAARLGIHVVHHVHTAGSLAQMEALLTPASLPLQPRAVTPPDLPAVAALGQAILPETWWGPILNVTHLGAHDADRLADRDAFEWMVGEGEALGWLRLLRGRTAVDRHTAELSVAVHPRARRRGLADQLMQESLRQARDEGITLVRAFACEDNGASRSLMARHGFTLEATFRGELRRPDGALRDMLAFVCRLDAPHAEGT
ncbi:MAG: HAD-IA family hydrolase [Chloroflexi bacterium]|nr:HAD-IA family hydrolase [Chloroflexota bacterium]